MAEIKSTMDLVMERASRMARESSGEPVQDDIHKKGMQLAARFMEGELNNLLEALTELPADVQMATRKGMVEVLLRNIFLPRDESGQQRSEKATDGIINLSGGAGDLAGICEELRHILGQYHQHREQLKEQLEEQVRMQYEQLMAQQDNGMQGQALSPEMALQAKVKEEWSRLEGELSDQYTQALEQHKTSLKERLCQAS